MVKRGCLQLSGTTLLAATIKCSWSGWRVVRREGGKESTGTFININILCVSHKGHTSTLDTEGFFTSKQPSNLAGRSSVCMSRAITMANHDVHSHLCSERSATFVDSFLLNHQPWPKQRGAITAVCLPRFSWDIMTLKSLEMSLKPTASKCSTATFFVTFALTFTAAVWPAWLGSSELHDF